MGFPLDLTELMAREVGLEVDPNPNPNPYPNPNPNQVGLTQSVRQAWRMNRQVSNGWIIGVATAFASSGVRITRVFAAAGQRGS